MEHDRSPFSGHAHDVRRGQFDTVIGEGVLVDVVSGAEPSRAPDHQLQMGAPSDGPSLSADRMTPGMSWRKVVEPLLLVGLDEPETAELRRRLDRPVLAFEILPRIRVDRGRLLVEHTNFMNHFVPVERAAYHAIFEDDFDFPTALALWGRPCLPGARGMMDLRLRLPGLVRALAVTRFGGIPRSYADRGTGIVKPYGVRHRDGVRYVIFQVWDFKGEVYDLAMYFVADVGGDHPATHFMRSRYSAIGTGRLVELMRQAGFSSVERLDGRFYQPVLVGTREG